jgi:two-component system, OmpR family, phosphate regulon sensor histidine kinase PhoR
MKISETPLQLSELESLRQKLDEANDTIEAIRAGQVDAFVVKDKEGPKVYTLKSADQTYRVFIEKMNEGAVTLNQNGVILYSNSRFAAMIKLPLSKIIGSHFKNYISLESGEVFNSLIEKGWKDECKGEIFLMTDKGEAIPVLASLTTLELDEGTALSLILTDLTFQKNIEKQLIEKNEQLEAARLFTEKLNDELELRVNERTNELLASREHFKFLADSIPVIVWTAKPNGDFDYFNHRWYNYTGLTFEESRGSGWQSVVHPDDLPNVITEWGKCLLSGELYKVEDRKRSADGFYSSFISNALPFKNSDGKIIAWFGVCTDIEEQKRDMEKKDQFISMASHELKTPVTSLKAYTEILMMDLEPKENFSAISMLGKMDKQIDKLTSLIGDLLDVSKANSGELNFNFEQVDLNELIKEVTGMMQLTRSNHKIELQLSDTPIIEGDKNRLGQVITNLLSNAIKYSPHADKIIVSSVNSKNEIKICVRDFGIGIPLSEQSKLFSRFFRVNNNTFPGLGLGLYICNEIIKRHSGTMEFKSEEGKGSTFCFTLPVLPKANS